MKVLIGIDGSDNSFAAVAFVGRLLRPGADQVVLCHSGDASALSGTADESLHDRARQAVGNVVLDEAKKRLPPALQAGVQTIVSGQQASEALIGSAEESGAGMIVVGARGLGPIESLLLGSVSSNVVRGSTVPVLIVRNYDEKSAAAGLRVVLAYDKLHAAQHATFLSKLTWALGVSGQIVAVIEAMMPGHLPEWIEKRARDADTEAMSQVWVREHQQEREEKERELAAFRQQLPPPLQAAKPIVAEGNPAEQLIELIERERASLVVMGKAMTNFFERLFVGSVSEKILSHANCSVLVIPAATS